MTKEKEIFLVVNGKLTKQKISDVTLAKSLNDPAIEAIFANCNPEDYFDQVLHLCYHRGLVISRIQDDIKIG